jgi:CubicO group peptidase (beta-lactamase class C family)
VPIRNAAPPPSSRIRPRRLRQVTVASALAALLVAVSTSTSNASPMSSSARSGSGTAARGPGLSRDPSQADAVRQVVRDTMGEQHLKAVIVRVSVNGKNVLTEAFGESMTGVPASTNMHFRNGAVAISYMSTLLLQLVDDKKVSLDDKVSKWLPNVPNSDQVTLGQLAHMTSGYADYVQNPEFIDAVFADPFREFTPEELIAYGTPESLLYEPGSNWNYSHTDYVILGLALEKITRTKMTTLMRDNVLRPLGLTNTTDTGTPAIPEPALHAFTSERREALEIPAGIPFYEESTDWNPSWTLARGAIQTTTIDDMHDTAVGIGAGKLLSRKSYEKMVSTELRGKTTALPGCSTCFEQSEEYTYGLGVIIAGDWLTQAPSFGGYAGAEAYLPSKKIAIAVTATHDQAYFEDPNLPSNSADALFRNIAAQIAPNDAPPAST